MPYVTKNGRRYLITPQGLIPVSLGSTTVAATPPVDVHKMEVQAEKAEVKEAKKEGDDIMEQLALISKRLRKL